MNPNLSMAARDLRLAADAVDDTLFTDTQDIALLFALDAVCSLTAHAQRRAPDEEYLRKVHRYAYKALNALDIHLARHGLKADVDDKMATIRQEVS